MDASNSLLFAGLLRHIRDAPAGYWLLWCALLAISVGVIVVLRTRWGHSRPLQKCAVLSLLVHLVLALLATTIRIVSGDGGGGGGGGGGLPIHVKIVQDVPTEVPANEIALSDLTTIEPPQLLEAPPEQPPAPEAIEPSAEESTADELPKETEPQADNPPEKAVEPEPAKTDIPVVADSQKQTAPEPVQTVTPPASPPETPIEPPSQIAATPKPEETAANVAHPVAPQPIAPTATPVAATTSQTAPQSAYALRNSPGKLSVIEGEGGNAETEAAVTAALAWLANAQSRDGRWDANQFGAGQEQLVLGQNRGGAGRNADTGVTALALLAFMGAGHSHLDGVYRDTVHRGLDFLLRTQADDGSLFGNSTLYAQMYCHSMATFAMAEALAMTGDRRLEPAVTKAVNFSIRAQNSTNGGWRYRPGDSGDTSQLGWQMMSLASADRAQVLIPAETWQRVDRFLHSVRRGDSGGLASYRPDSPATTSMTAEAMYCRLLLKDSNGVAMDDAAKSEASARILADLPTMERINLYYWYYATLALHHSHTASDQATAAWRTWNDALTSVLVGSQVADGDNAGSWNANTVWGGYGGRVYTTAMAAMSLEVYYRYAVPTSAGGEWMAARPQPQQSSK